VDIIDGGTGTDSLVSADFSTATAGISINNVTAPTMVIKLLESNSNTKVLARLRQLGLKEEQVTDWARWTIREGFAACEKLIAGEPGPFCFGAAPTIADLCLVPQLANARRFGVDVQAFPRLLQAEAAAKAMPAFADAAPDRQPDAE